MWMMNGAVQGQGRHGGIAIKRLFVVLSAKYAHKNLAVSMWREDCALCESCARQGIAAHALETETSRPCGDTSHGIAHGVVRIGKVNGVPNKAAMEA
jgi:hypothetical protein